jgi:hypothetical protein
MAQDQSAKADMCGAEYALSSNKINISKNLCFFFVVDVSASCMMQVARETSL